VPDPKDNPLVYVELSAIHGRGLFAAENLESGCLIGVYEGPESREDGRYVLWVEDDTADGWTGYDGRNSLRYMNHADKPNAEMDGQECYALEDIPAGSEITIDYGWDAS
jgi:SET domain-containing protein